MKRQFILFSLLSIIVHASYSVVNEKTALDKQFVLGLDFGVTVKNNAVSNTQFPLGYSTFRYTPHQNDYSARYGVSLGHRFAINSFNNLIIGLGYHQFSPIHVTGTLEQGITPPLYKANYQYNLQLSQLLAEVKLQHEWHQIYPYVVGGIGCGFNKAKEFSTNVPQTLTFTPTYTNHSDSSLSYMLGLGIDIPFLPNATIGVGYAFSDLGRVGLGDGSIRGRRVPNNLTQSHFYTNTLLAQLSLYF
ncbi:outer membrane protein [Legionella septentrionalis]|uniref:outer membrane protein n=1 Tax=Legionella septentrionalis TaxID=2498109 RepID=UPI000F8DF4D0|nr:outer membrane beta-barrel protein [Legionella septentrionalis]RUR08610.1 hypothetical protein ELY14_11095 [Legionella septentrionalis]